MKRFLVTVDTEGDNLWAWKPGKEITTENARYIPRFQTLCEAYGFKPVYLTNYEMAKDAEWVKYSTAKAREGKCEIGMHLHAWNTPPEYALTNRFDGNPYITEYPEEIMEQKVATVIKLLQETYEMPMVSHRAGRWATNDRYLDILVKYGIKIDCSVTPELDLSRLPGCAQNCGNNYRNAAKGIHWIRPGLLEIPMTTRRIRHCCTGSWKHRLKTLILGDDLWLRPVSKSLDLMKLLTHRVIREGNDEYLEFMVHSSELMPGGSIYFQTEEAVEFLYQILETYFIYLSKLGYSGQVLQDFAKVSGEII